jgi:mannose-1-phosphate guanylyltransferase
MITNPSDYHRLWSVILAGNEPSALDPFIKLWQGVPTPKPYCTFVGTRSLLQHTWDLADQFSHPESKVTVVTQPFLQQTFRQFGGRVPGLIATEPFQKGSLASTLLGLAAVRAQDPQSTLVVFPSQAFIHPELKFLRTLHRAVWAAKLLHDRMVVFGASSKTSVGKFGWLRPTEQLCWTSGLPVQALEMKFTPTISAHSIPSTSSPHSDLLLNSGMLLAKTEVLWNACERIFPAIVPYLERLGSVASRPEKHNQNTVKFQELPSGCLWKDFLCQIPNHLCMVGIEDVTWSDWENPTHIGETLSMLGKNPVFPAHWISSDNPPRIPLKQEVKF